MNIEAKKKELARAIERYDNSLDRAKEANMHEICMMWMRKKEGLQEAFRIVFDQEFIDWWIEKVSEDMDT